MWLISSFVFATYKVQSLYFFNPKFLAINHILWLYRRLCVGPGLKPYSRFSHDVAPLKLVFCIKNKVVVISQRLKKTTQTGLNSHSQQMARGLHLFRIEEVEGLYYPCSQNKGHDQLKGYCAADLRLFAYAKSRFS